jgi:signal transduction histidine kinase
LGRLLSFTALSLLVAWVVGDAAERRTQVRRAMEGELARRRNRVRLRVQAVALEERLRITRELHDLVGEALDAVVVQATAARAQLGRPEVDRPLAAIEKTGRGALAELDRFLGYLRQPTVRGPDTSAPVPVPVAVAEGRRLPWPLRQRFLSGVGPVLGVGFLAFVDALSTPAESWPVPLWPVVLAALVALPLLRRARNPEAVLGFLLALLAGLALLGLAVDGGLLALAVALHAVAVRGSRGRALGAAALTCALAVTVTAAIIDLREATQLAGPLLGLAAIALYVGDTARVAREHNATLTQRIAEAAGEERLRERVAVMEERTRMARDLHDSIGHTFSLVVLQAGAARLATTSPETPSAERIAVALRSIEASARGALEELDAVVQSMDRDASGDPPFVPAPEDLHAVVDSVRTAGTGVSVAADPTGDLPRPVQITILRIVQEALTNVVKHAPGATATVEVKRADDSVRVTVHNDAGSRPDQALPSGGRGLIGMQERVSLLGGDFLAGRDIDGGHRVDARIPLPRSPSSSPSLTRTGDSR